MSMCLLYGGADAVAADVVNMRAPVSSSVTSAERRHPLVPCPQPL